MRQRDLQQFLADATAPHPGAIATVRRYKRHAIVALEHRGSKALVTMGSTISDTRGLVNVRACIRRYLRQMEGRSV